jgi:hypothetical protein
MISSLTETSLNGQAGGDDKTYQIKALSMVLELFNENLKSHTGDNIRYVIQEGILRFLTDSTGEDILAVDDMAAFEVTTTGIRIICKQPFRIFTLTYNPICCI